MWPGLLPSGVPPEGYTLYGTVHVVVLAHSNSNANAAAVAALGGTTGPMGVLQTNRRAQSDGDCGYEYV